MLGKADGEDLNGVPAALPITSKEDELKKEATGLLYNCSQNLLYSLNGEFCEPQNIPTGVKPLNFKLEGEENVFSLELPLHYYSAAFTPAAVELEDVSSSHTGAFSDDIDGYFTPDNQNFASWKVPSPKALLRQAARVGYDMNTNSNEVSSANLVYPLALASETSFSNSPVEDTHFMSFSRGPNVVADGRSSKDISFSDVNPPGNTCLKGVDLVVTKSSLEDKTKKGNLDSFPRVSEGDEAKPSLGRKLSSSSVGTTSINNPMMVDVKTSHERFSLEGEKYAMPIPAESSCQKDGSMDNVATLSLSKCDLDYLDREVNPEIQSPKKMEKGLLDSLLTGISDFRAAKEFEFPRSTGKEAVKTFSSKCFSKEENTASEYDSSIPMEESFLSSSHTTNPSSMEYISDSLEQNDDYPAHKQQLGDSIEMHDQGGGKTAKEANFAEVVLKGEDLLENMYILKDKEESSTNITQKATAIKEFEALIDLECSLAGMPKDNLKEEIRSAPLNADPVDLKDVKKKAIWIVHKGVKVPVSWFDGVPAEDLRLAILDACDAIMDSGFALQELKIVNSTDQAWPFGADTIEVDGVNFLVEKGREFTYDTLHLVEDGKVYLMKSAVVPNDAYSNIVDRSRRLKVDIEPMQHVEVRKAIDLMKKGCNLLKHTSYGNPHLRQFQLSNDNKRIIWYTGAKSIRSSMVLISDISEIKTGQETPNFKAYRVPSLEHLSFSLLYTKGTRWLDLTCKDEFEFDYWLTGIKGLFFSSNGWKISKNTLLEHSRVFRKAVTAENRLTVNMSAQMYVKQPGRCNFSDCVPCPLHSPRFLERKLCDLRDRLGAAVNKYNKFEERVSNTSGPVELLDNKNEGFTTSIARLSKEEDITDDDIMEAIRVNELIQKVSDIAKEINTGIIGFKVNSNQKELEKTSEAALNSEKSTYQGFSRVGSSPLTDAGDTIAFMSMQLMENINKFIGLTTAEETYADEIRQELKNMSSAELLQLRTLSGKLWEAEVDMENVEDMLCHLDASHAEKSLQNISKAVEDMGCYVSAEVQKIKHEVALYFNS